MVGALTVYGETAMSRRDADAAFDHAHVVDWKHRLVWMAIGLVILGAAILLRLQQGAPAAPAAAPVAPATAAADEAPLPRVGRPQHDVMAIVNGKDISRKDLTDACVRRYGEDVLESLTNKKLITNHCAKRGIVVTNDELTAEIDRMAQRFQLGREQWLAMLEKERGVTAQEYARDIVWPTLALRKLA